MSEMSQRELGSDTATCPTCGAVLGTSVSAYGSISADPCLVCYGSPESAPAPVEEPQTAAEDALPRELGTDVTGEEN